MEENTNLELDTSSIKEREGATTSSLTDRNKVPVFSDAFENALSDKRETDDELTETLIESVFDDKLVEEANSDVRTQMFLNTTTELMIRSDNVSNSSKSYIEIAAGIIMAGILAAIMIMYYGRNGKGKKNADNHNKKRKSK